MKLAGKTPGLVEISEARSQTLLFALLLNPILSYPPFSPSIFQRLLSLEAARHNVLANPSLKGRCGNSVSQIEDIFAATREQDWRHDDRGCLGVKW